MTSARNRIVLRVPIIVMILAATAIPVEWRTQGHVPLDFYIQASDVLANVAGYVPVGIVLGELGLLPAAIAAALISTVAESSQFLMMHRDPSAIDVASNVIGAILGIVVAVRWRIRSPGLTIDQWRALAAAAMAVALVVGVWATSGDALSARGATSPGTLEAYWKLDENDGRVAVDSSGHGLSGTFSRQPARVAGAIGGAARFDGAKDSIDFGHATPFRIVGSVTISAWIKSTSHPIDNAAIVSSFSNISGGLSGGDGLGFQLDTTTDRGPRTIGFRLGDVCGDVMARYGATPLRLDTWYHVAGVYDADARTMSVYLNGELDNGFQLGTVTGRHRASREDVYVGRRADRKGFEFAGLIDEVRIYSLALTKPEIMAVMNGGAVQVDAAQREAATQSETGHGAGPIGDRYAACSWSSEREDARIPGAVASFGVLLAVACIGLWPSAGPMRCLLVSFLGGWLLFPFAASTLPSLNLWMFPLTSLAGGASVAVSLRRSASQRSKSDAEFDARQ